MPIVFVPFETGVDVRAGGALAAAHETAGCRTDICGDLGGDCCAPWGEGRSCTEPGYEEAPGGVSTVATCSDDFAGDGFDPVYQCCPRSPCKAAYDYFCGITGVGGALGGWCTAAGRSALRATVDRMRSGALFDVVGIVEEWDGTMALFVATLLSCRGSIPKLPAYFYFVAYLIYVVYEILATYGIIKPLCTSEWCF